MNTYYVLDLEGNILLQTHKAEDVLYWLADPHVGVIWLTPADGSLCECYYEHPKFKGNLNAVSGARI